MRISEESIVSLFPFAFCASFVSNFKKSLSPSAVSRACGRKGNSIGGNYTLRIALDRYRYDQ